MFWSAVIVDTKDHRLIDMKKKKEKSCFRVVLFGYVLVTASVHLYRVGGGGGGGGACSWSLFHNLLLVFIAVDVHLKLSRKRCESSNDQCNILLVGHVLHFVITTYPSIQSIRLSIHTSACLSILCVFHHEFTSFISLPGAEVQSDA